MPALKPLTGITMACRTMSMFVVRTSAISSVTAWGQMLRLRSVRTTGSIRAREMTPFTQVQVVMTSPWARVLILSMPVLMVWRTNGDGFREIPCVLRAI